MSIKIDRCLCNKISFKEIHLVAQQENIKTLEELQVRKGICNSCRLCNPYIHDVLSNGVFEFHAIKKK